MRASHRLANSVTRWSDYLSIIVHLQQWKLAQECHKYAKIGSAFFQIRKNIQNLPKTCKLLPNPVTLVLTFSGTLLFRHFLMKRKNEQIHILSFLSVGLKVNLAAVLQVINHDYITFIRLTTGLLLPCDTWRRCDQIWQN